MLSSKVFFPKCVVSKNYCNLTLPHMIKYNVQHFIVMFFILLFSSNLPNTNKRSVNMMENISSKKDPVITSVSLLTFCLQISSNNFYKYYSSMLFLYGYFKKQLEQLLNFVTIKYIPMKKVDMANYNLKRNEIFQKASHKMFLKSYSQMQFGLQMQLHFLKYSSNFTAYS